MNGWFTNLGRVLTGRLGTPEVHPLTRRDLILALLCAWLAGIGRYWDHPVASFAQKLGIGSVVYVFLLAALIWLLGRPLRIIGWRYLDLLTFISLTLPLAFLYALPVERWVSLPQARNLNIWFLGVVALWRVVLYGLYLFRRQRLPVSIAAVLLFLPLTLIITALWLSNLDHVVWNIMARPGEESMNDHGSGAAGTFTALLILTVGSVYSFPVLAIWYLVAISRRQRSENSAAS